MIPEEIIESVMSECISPRWRLMAESYKRSLRYPRESEAITLGEQIPYVQKKLRRHETEIREIFERGLSDCDLETALGRFGLRGELISTTVVLACLEDLQIEQAEMMERRFGDYLLSMAYPTIAKYDKDAVSVDKWADELGLVLIEPDWERGQYLGQVIVTDNQFGLIQYAREKAIKLLFWDLPDEQPRPKTGDTVRMKFNAGTLVVNVAERQRRS